MTDSSRSDGDARSSSREKRALGGELIIPVGTILFAIYYLYTVWELPWQAKSAGLGIASAMAIVLVLLGVRFARDWSAGRAHMGLGDLAVPVPTLAQRLVLLAAALVFIFIMPLTGFTAGLFLFLMTAIMILAGPTRLKAAAVISLLVSIGGYLLFIVFVRARFPHGPIETFLGSLF